MESVSAVAPTLPYTSLQQVFDIIWQRFVVEGKPQSTNEHGKCQYGTADSCCFIGACLPDDGIRAVWDSKWSCTIETISWTRPHDYHLIFNGLDANTLAELQAIHDEWENNGESFADHCRSSLTAFAADHNLTTPQEPAHAE